MIYLQHFKTLIDYNIYKNSYEFVLPNVSSCEEDLDFIVYNPEDEESGSGSGSGSGSEGGPSEPVLEENQVLCKYNVTSTTSATKLLHNQLSFASMLIDGVEQSEVMKSYIFDTTGEHTILFILAEGVTSIGADVFYNCSRLTSITIPGLTNITIPDSVTSIGVATFYGCSGLTSIIIGNSVTSIGDYAFKDCSELISIICNATSAPTISSSTFKNIKSGGTLTVLAGSTGYDVWVGTGDYYLGKYNWTKVEESGEQGSQGEQGGPSEPVLEENQVLCKYNVTSTTYTTQLLDNNSSFALMSIDGVEQSGVVSSYTFDTTGEHTVLFRLAEGVTSISKYAFKNCSGLTSITIPNSVTSIGNGAFYNCSGLTSITISNSVTSISASAFQSCTRLTAITIPNSITSIGDSAFRYCTGLISITIPNSVTSIDSNAFGYCTGLTSITIDNSVASIGSSAFYNCSGLTSITIPDSVTSISDGVFCNCSGLTSITIPGLVTSIGKHAFSGCSGLTNITIPNSVTSIGESAFVSCSGLTSITIPNSVTSIGSSAFDNCTGLTSITIPDSVTSIGSSAFYNCSGLTSITIPDSVTSIGSGAFSYCSGLTNITIPDSVTSIGNVVFSNCSGLTSITCNATTAPTISSTTFYYVKTGGTLTVPAGSTGYDVWMGTDNYYLGKYNWTKVEVLEENQVLCKYNVTSTTSATNLLHNQSSFASMLIDGVEQSEVMKSYIFDTTGEHTILFILAEGVTSIGADVFYNCSRLTSITIPQ